MKTLSTKTKVLILLSIACAMGSCVSTEKLIREGRYESAINRSHQKLNKGKQKQKHVLAMEEAFRKATDRDMKEVLSVIE